MNEEEDILRKIYYADRLWKSALKESGAERERVSSCPSHAVTKQSASPGSVPGLSLDHGAQTMPQAATGGVDGVTAQATEARDGKGFCLETTSFWWGSEM
jgi:hypothetical protein